MSDFDDEEYESFELDGAGKPGDSTGAPAESDEETYSPAFLSRRGGADQPVNQRAIDFFRELQVIGRDAAGAEQGFDATGERGRRTTQRLGAALSR